MPVTSIRIPSRSGGSFDGYLATPSTNSRMPAIVLASAIHGVDRDIRDLADAFAAQGFIAAAPDLFWRSVPGPLPRSDKRAAERAQPRLPRIKAGEEDLADTLKALHQFESFNGRAAIIGFCYAGPYAILGPKRLGYAAGISCHGTQLGDFVDELDGVTAPLCFIWGDQDHAAPPPVLDAYRAVTARMSNVQVHVFPGINHGYMMPDAHDAYDKKTRDFSFARAIAILESLRGGDEKVRRAS